MKNTESYIPNRLGGNLHELIYPTFVE